MDQVDESLALILLLVVKTVEPDERHRTVLGEQLAQLTLHIIKVARPLGAGRIAVPSLLDELSCVPVARVVHVGWGVIKPERHPGFPGCLGQHRYNILAIRRIGNLVVGKPRVEHTKAVMVLGGNNHVTLSGLLGERNPGRRIVLGGVEFLVQQYILRLGDVPVRLRRHDGP